VKKIIFCLLCPLIFIYVLPACQNVAPTGQSVPLAIQPDPTSTPTQAAPEHTPTPISVVSDLIATSTYTHTTSRFSIDYPENWQFSEQPDGTIFVEPGDRGGYSVFFNDVGEVYSKLELNQFLVTFVVENFVEEGSGFEAISQEAQADGSIEAQFVTLDPRLGRTINAVRVLQEDTIVFVLLISVTEEQWAVSQNKLQALADTLTPLDTTPLAEAPPTEEPPVWLLIGPISNQFAFFYPSDWAILRQDENTVVVTMPDTEIVFEASTFDWSGADNDLETTEKAAQAYLTNLSKKYKEIENLPANEFPLDTATGATIDFLYTTAEDQTMAGSVIMAASEGQMYRVVFTAPAEFYQAALEWFNPMYKSFKILSPDDLRVE
jgi:hypothetical protein